LNKIDCSLANWMKEKAERKDRLHRLNERIRQGSVCSTTSQSDPDKAGEGTRAGSIDLVLATDIRSQSYDF
jgi:hypothetical protein